LKAVDFSGKLVRKHATESDEITSLCFMTENAEKVLLAQNPLLLARLRIGVTYRIKGHERTVGGKTYVRLMSAKPQESKPTTWYGTAVFRGSVSFVLVAVIACIVAMPSTPLLSGEDAAPSVDTVHGIDGGLFNGVLYHAVPSPPTASSDDSSSSQTRVHSSQSPPSETVGNTSQGPDTIAEESEVTVSSTETSSSDTALSADAASGGGPTTEPSAATEPEQPSSELSASQSEPAQTTD
jgi:hypothetical protein